MITQPHQRMEGVGDHLSLQGAGQIRIKLSYPGSAFLLRVCWMSKSKVYVTSLLCNSGQNINHLCVLLGALRHGWSQCNTARDRLCWEIASSSHRTWPDICPGVCARSPRRLTNFSKAFSLFRQKPPERVVHTNILSLWQELGWGGWRPPAGKFPRKAV